MTHNFKILAYLQNSHFQERTKNSILNDWISKTQKKFNHENLSMNSEIRVVQESESFEKDFQRIDKILSEEKYDFFFGLTKEYIRKKGINFFTKKNCIYFSIENLDGVDLLNSNVFSTSSNLFTKTESILWIARKLNTPKILLFNDDSFDTKDLKETIKNEKFDFKIKEITLDKNTLKNFCGNNEVKRNELKFVTEVSKISENTFKFASDYINNKKIKLDNKTLVVHNIKLRPSFFLINALKRISKKLHIFDLGRTSWIPEGTEKYFESYQLFPRFLLNEESKLYYPNATEFERFDIEEFYETIYDPLFCIRHLVDRHNIKSKSRNEFISLIAEKLKKMKEMKDVYLGMWKNYSFDGNELSNKESFFYKQGEILEINKNIPLYFPYQPFDKNHKNDKEVWYLYLDVKKVSNIDIEKGLWFCEIEIELNSPKKDPIKYINFSNNSALDDLWDVKIINEFKFNDRYQTKYRIHASFDFVTNNNDYPFDKQTIGIEYSLESSVKNSVLQPTPKDYVDNYFFISGWKLMKSESGILYKRVYNKIGTDLQTVPVEVGITKSQWEIRRKNVISSVKSFLPLYILLFLCWYSSFLDVDEATTAVGINTTVFLSGIALYFASDKPKTSVLTVLDKFFICFYCSVGLLIGSEFSIFISEQMYKLFHTIWQIAIPILSIVSIIYLKKKSTNL